MLVGFFPRNPNLQDDNACLISKINVKLFLKMLSIICEAWPSKGST
jgi:hypothetical protein